MPENTVTNKVAQSFQDVNHQLPLFDLPSPASMIHHKAPSLPGRVILRDRDKPYGVSLPLPRSRRVLSPGLFRKRYDDIRGFMRRQFGLTPAQLEITIRLLRFWAYYGLVCPKQSTVTDGPELTAEMVSWRASVGLGPPHPIPGCSKATYWRTIKLLKDYQLVEVINRYILRPHAQISNLYRFDRLMVILARYLAERGVKFLEEWLIPYLRMPGSLFWGSFSTTGEPGLSSSPLGAP